MTAGICKLRTILHKSGHFLIFQICQGPEMYGGGNYGGSGGAGAWQGQGQGGGYGGMDKNSLVNTLVNVATNILSGAGQVTTIVSPILS